MKLPKKTGRTGRAAPAGPKSGKPAGTRSAPARGRASGPGEGEVVRSAQRPRPTGKTTPRAARSEAPTLDAPAPDTVFTDRDGERHSFPDSSLRRVAARLLSEQKKRWRYRPFGFPLFTQSGREQTFTPDFVVYDNQEAVIRIILIAPRDTAEVWDRLGRFKRQYAMYPYELWTPDKLAQLSRPRARLGF